MSQHPIRNHQAAIIGKAPQSGRSGSIVLCAFTALLMTGLLGAAGPQQAGGQKGESFDRDPGWEGFNNRMAPDKKDVHKVVQDFGYSATNHAGGEKGEMGGQVQRSKTPAFYADKIPIKTLNDKLTAS